MSALAGATWAEPTSRTDERLRRILRQYPQADVNGDGVLTMTEAQEARQRLIDAAAKAGPRRGVSPTRENVRYGPHDRNVLDFWKAKSDGPAPLVVYIHGGGFVGGDKALIRQRPDLVEAFLDRGVSVAAINYRFLSQASLPEIFRDCARAVQFMRHKAGEWNLDKTRVGAFGESAGAGCAMWLGFHDNLSDPQNADPVLRESTRLSVVGANMCQFTYDTRQWEKVVGRSPGGKLTGAEMLNTPKGPIDPDSPEGKRFRADIDVRGHMTRGDAPVFLCSMLPNVPARDANTYLHHPAHAAAIRSRARKLGIPVVCVTSESPLPRGRKTEEAMLEFFLQHLGLAAASGAK